MFIIKLIINKTYKNFKYIIILMINLIMLAFTMFSKLK